MYRFPCSEFHDCLCFIPHYHKSRKLYKLLKLSYGLPHWIWLRVIFNWLWTRLTFTKELSMQVSSGLYEFTHMPFGLSNASASFCHLIEMCHGDQQYLTLLFYLDDIYIFSSSIDEMLDRIALVLNRLQEFNLKFKPKKSFLFQSNILFLGHMLSKDGISPQSSKK